MNSNDAILEKNEVSNVSNLGASIAAADAQVIDESLGLKKYLTFSLNGERYGMLLSVVREIVGMYNITEVPNVPSYFKGLINLRGKIISVIDLKNKLNLLATSSSAKMSSIIITQVNELTIGIIIDQVNDVIGLHKDQIETKINAQSKINRDFIAGIAKEANKQLILLLNFEKILSIDELKIPKKKS